MWFVRMERTVLDPDELAPPNGFNHGIVVDGGRTLYLAGQDASGPDGDIVARGDLVGQFERALENLATVVEEAGGTSEDVVKLTIYVADREEYRANLGPLGDVFGQYFEEYPAVALFEVSGFFEADALVELEGTAVLDGGDDDAR